MLQLLLRLPPPVLAGLGSFLGALSTVSYLFSIADTDDREWLAWRRVYSTDELRAVWERRESDPLLLLIVVGKVFDVSAGRTYYGSEGAGYEGFASGYDNSRAFLTADFEHNATDNLDGLTPPEYLGVEHWAQFYENHAKYTYAGVHRGRYFDARGRKTAARREYERNVAAAEAERAIHVARMLAATRCTVEAASGMGRGVWKAMSCEAPLVPRWLIIMDHGKLCVCLPYHEGDEAEPEDQERPHKYKTCAANATSCVARTG